MIPEIRMASLPILMKTIPGPQLIDQITNTISNEQSKDVFSFAYNYIKSLSKTRNPMLSKMAAHLQNAIKLINVDEKTLKMSTAAHLPLWSFDDREGIFIDLFAAFLNNQTIHASASLSSLLANEFQQNDFSISFSKQNSESTGNFINLIKN